MQPFKYFIFGYDHCGELAGAARWQPGGMGFAGFVISTRSGLLRLGVHRELCRSTHTESSEGRGRERDISYLKPAAGTGKEGGLFLHSYREEMVQSSRIELRFHDTHRRRRGDCTPSAV